MKKAVFQNLENHIVTGDPGHAHPQDEIELATFPLGLA